jgi:hypothetical protein
MADQKTIPEFDTDVEVIENSDFATYDRGTAENPDTTEGTTEPTTANEGVEDTLADQDVIEIDNTEREEDDGPITVEASVSDPTEQTVSEDVTDATVHESSESVLGNAAAFLLSGLKSVAKIPRAIASGVMLVLASGFAVQEAVTGSVSERGLFGRSGVVTVLCSTSVTLAAIGGGVAFGVSAATTVAVPVAPFGTAIQVGLFGTAVGILPDWVF